MLKQLIARLAKRPASRYLPIIIGALMVTLSAGSAPSHGFRLLPPQDYSAPDQDLNRQGQSGNYFASGPQGNRRYRPAAARWPSSPELYRFRSMPDLPTAADYLPKFRPDHNAGRQPSNWPRDSSYWQSESGGRPPVFRPIGNEWDGRKRSAPIAGQQPAWPSLPDSPQTSGEFSPGWMGFGPSPAD